MNTRELNNRIKEYLQKRKEIAVLQKQLDEAKSDKGVLEGTVINAFKEAGIRKRVYYGRELMLLHKTDIKIYDEEALLREFRKLKDMDYIGEFTKQKIDAIKFKRFARALLKDKKQLMPGTESAETDYIRVADYIGDIIGI